MFSKSCEYGIKAMIYIATQSLQDKRVKIGDIAENIVSPEAFTAKILGALVKQHLVQSHTGPNGGFQMDKNTLNQIRLSQIVFAIDGEGILYECGLGLKHCSNTEPCPVHDKFTRVRTELVNMLETTTVYDLAIGLQTGRTILS
jgi:Rrf2 family transcriptional regulator, iron-sulfur cluster assembly transcription factor